MSNKENIFKCKRVSHSKVMCCTLQQEHIHCEYHVTKADKTLNLSLSSHTRSKSLFWGDLRLSKSDHIFQLFYQMTNEEGW